MTRILVIDDDPMVGKTLVDLLGLHGYPATRAESGEQGLEALAEASRSTSSSSTCACPG